METLLFKISQKIEKTNFKYDLQGKTFMEKNMEKRFSEISVFEHFDAKSSKKYNKIKKNHTFQCGFFGGRYKTRTCDLPHVKRMRYQLRQSSVFGYQQGVL